MALNVSLFPSITSTRPDLRYGVSWVELDALLGPHKPWPAKGAGGLYSACEWQPGHGPSKEEGDRFVVALHVGVFDLDKATEDDVAEICAALPCRWLLLSTFSHGPKQAKYRVLLEYSRPVLKSEHAHVWDRVNQNYLKSIADTHCRDIGHRYYFPSHPEAPELPPVRIHSGDAPPLAVDALLGEHVARLHVGDDDQGLPTATGAGIQVTRDQVRRIGDALARSKNKADLGNAMRALLKGDPYADKGFRHGTTFRIVCEILDRHPLADPQSIIGHFTASLALMQPTHVDPAVILTMIQGKQAIPRGEQAQLLEEAFASHGGGRATTYTEEDLDAFAELLEVPRARLNRRWIVQMGTSHYVFCNGKYEHYTNLDVVNGAHRDLAPAITAGVDLMMVTPRSARSKTAVELVHDYGVVATSVVIDYRAQFARYDDTTKTMIEAPCPIRVKPEYNPEIAKWLQIFAGPKHDRLLQWLAATTMLDQPCAALYLEGPPGAGKTILAVGVSHIYTDDRPTDLDEAMGPFNEQLMRCPIVFGDETAPVDARGKLRTPEIREFIQARQRALKRKFRPNATVRGCTRLILAANNQNLLETTEHLTENDIAAIVERFFYLPVQREAVAYLTTLGRDVVSTWIEKDAVAKHCLWLSENIVVPRNTRFLVSGEASDLTRSLASGTGQRANICQWLVFYLQAPTLLNSTRHRHFVRVKGGKLYVNVMALWENWNLYLKTTKDAPSTMIISKALAGLSVGAAMRDLDNPTHIRRFRIVDVSLLVEWALNADVASEEEILQYLANIDEDRPKALPPVPPSLPPVPTSEDVN